MTLKELRDSLGSNINQIGDTGEFVDDFVRTSEANRWLQEAFQNVYKWYALANKSRFSETAHSDVTANNAIYALGGDATDALAVSEVYIKKIPTDTDYFRVYPLDTSDFYKHGAEKVPQNAPRYSEITIKNTATNKYVLAIELFENAVPEFDIEKGLRIRYISRPPALLLDTDEPQRIPPELQPLIVTGATIPAMRKMGESEEVDRLSMEFERGIRNMFTQEQSLSTKGIKTVSISRRDVSRFYLKR